VGPRPSKAYATAGPFPFGALILKDKRYRHHKVDAENKVFKTGSTTGTTYGKLSAIKADVRFTRTLPDAGRVSFLTTKLVVLDETPNNRFANVGDPGAVISTSSWRRCRPRSTECSPAKL
jgi:hypothetical protein